MTKIFKFPIEPKEPVQTINLPEGAEIISLGVQVQGSPYNKGTGEALFFWALVDPEAPARPRRLLCVGTGWPISVDIKRVYNSVVTSKRFVWHLLEVK